MKYRLKDHELQTKLDELSTEFKFSDRLQLAMRKFKQDGVYWDSNLIRVQFGKIVGFTHDDDKEWVEALTRDFEQGEDGGFDLFTAHAFYLNPDEDVEKIPEYNPYAWNKYPDVTPPEDVPMRCEIDRKDGRKGLVVAYFKEMDDGGGAWLAYDMSGYALGVCRFRPWDDGEDEE